MTMPETQPLDTGMHRGPAKPNASLPGGVAFRVRQRGARVVLCALASRFLASGILLVPAAAGAQAELHGLVKLTSDYLDRSYSKSDGRPAVQGNADYLSDSGFYAGAWLSQVDFGGAECESIGYAGLRRPVVGPVDLDLSLTQYWYNAKVFGRSADYDELDGAIHFGERATLSVSFAPNPYGREHRVTNAQIELRHPLTDMAELSASAGYEWAAQAYANDNVHWNAGMTWFLGRHMALDVRYIGAREVNAQPYSDDTEDQLSDAAFRDRLVLSISVGR
jgi:uncharacterized protein (TIGR02001 family)